MTASAIGEAVPARASNRASIYGLSALALCALLLFAPTTASLFRLWNAFGSRFYTFGDFIVLLSLLCLVHRRAALQSCAFVPSRFGTALLLPVSLSWLLLYKSTVQVAHQACLPLIIWCLIYAVAGWRMARICLFPIAYLYFAIPIWQWLVPLLQHLTIAAMYIVLPLIGIPAHIVGADVEVPAGHFIIEDGCGGHSYFMVALAIAAFCGDQQHCTGRSRVALMAVGAALAILGNWIRVAGVIIAGELTAMQSYLVRVSHDGFGWAIFGGVMVLFVWIAPRLAESKLERVAPVPPRSDPSMSLPVAMVAAMALLATGPVWSTARSLLEPHGRAQLALRSNADWLGPIPYRGPWNPQFVGSDSSQIGVYGDLAGERVVVFSSAYASQDPDHRLHLGNDQLINDDAYHAVAQRKSAEGRLFYSETEVEDRSGMHWLIDYFYKSGAHLSASAIEAQAWYALQSLVRATPIGVVAIKTQCTSNCAAASGRLRRFMDDNVWLLSPIQLRLSNGA